MTVNTSSDGPRSGPVPRDAATVVVVRDGAQGLEVLLLQRAERGDHNSGAWVFPGGLLDAADRAPQALASGLADADASARLGLAGGGLAFYLAAIRECFEESGILFAVDAQGVSASFGGDAGARLSAARHELQDGACDLAAICGRFSLRPAPEQLHYVGHWLTPVGRAKRFDTRFFLAIAPAGQAAMHDAAETLDHVWLAPAEALSPRNARRLMTPTRAMLELLLPFATTAALGAWAAGPRRVERVLPRLAQDAGGLRPVLPHEPAWAEIGKLDPGGRGDAWCVLRPEVAVQISDHVVRVPSAVTGRNSYLVGSSQEGWAAVDPASADAAHLEALLGAAPGGIRAIVVARTDDAAQAAARQLQARTGATVVSRGGDHAMAGSSLTLRICPAAEGLQCLVVQDRVALASGPAALDPQLRAGADWLAPPQGFLQALAPPV